MTLGQAPSLRAFSLPGTRRFRVRSVARLLLASPHVSGLLDQAIVSGVSFLTLVLVAAFCSASEVGIYALAISIFVVSLAVQDALITRPYTLRLRRPLGTAQEHAFACLIFSLLLGGLGGLLGTIVWGWLFASQSSSANLGMMLALALPFVLLREFARRFDFAHMRYLQVLALDSSVAALYLLLLGGIVLSNSLSPASAIAAQGIACALISVAWLWRNRGQLSPNRHALKSSLRGHWQIAKWLVATQSAVQTQGYAVQWLTLFYVGAAATGIYAVCLSVVSLANPILFGLLNVLMPTAVHSMAQGGKAALWRRALADLAIITILMIVFCTLIYAFGETIMALFFPHFQNPEIGPLLLVLALTTLVGAAGLPASVALMAADHVRTVAIIAWGSALFTLALGAALILHSGVLGAAYAILAAELCSTAARWVALARLIPAAQTYEKETASC